MDNQVLYITHTTQTFIVAKSDRINETCEISDCQNRASINAVNKYI